MDATSQRTRCAIYLRISLDATGEQLAVQRQREDCQAIARQRGWHVVAEFVDNSVSASTRKRRPGYDKLVAAYAAGEYDALVCWDLDRLTRQPRQLEDWIDAATDKGLLLVTANGEADLSTDAGRLFARIKASVSRAEVERKSARQRRAALQRADRGRPPLGARPIGYATTGAIVEHEAAVVRRVFARFAAGDSLRSLASWLDETGVPTRHGGRWNSSSVSGMLTNPRYAGRAIYQGKETGKPGAWQPIIDDDTYTLVQSRLSDPRRKTNKYGTDRKHLGAGLYECGLCGRRVTSWTGNRYRCPDGCLTRAQSGIDGLVLDVVRARLAAPELAALLAEDSTDEARAIGEQIRRLQARLTQIGDDYDADRIDGRRYAIATEKVRAELAAATSAQARLSTSAGAGAILHTPDPVAAFDSSPLMIRRNIIDFLCTVRLLPAQRGRKAFDPSTVVIRWKTGQ